MLTVEKLGEFIIFVLNNAAVTVIRQKQEKKSPAKPYAAFRIMSNRAFGQSTDCFDEREETPGVFVLDETIERKRVLIVELQFFTQTETQAIAGSIPDYIAANDLAVNFQDKIDLSRSGAFQKKNGFSVTGVTTIQDIDAQLGDRWERRALCELRIHATTSITEETDSYDPNTALNIETNIEGL